MSAEDDARDLAARGATTRDGRNVDPRLGTLEGEASAMVVHHSEREFPGRNARDATMAIGAHDAPGPSYYGQPVLKEPVWIWTVPTYFVVGGLAGAASVIGAACRLADARGLDRLGTRARWLAFGGDVASAGLLIADLGRPARFLNMLRVFRPSSPMSVGSWILTASGALNTIGAATAALPSWTRLGRLGELAEYGGALLGMPLAGYTAVLVTNTAVPVWQLAGRTLPALFITSAMASTAALLDATDLGPREHRMLRPLAVIAGAASLAAGVAVELDVARSPRAVRPLRQGASGALWTASRVLTAASVVLSALPAPRRKRARWTRQIAGVLGLAGAAAARFAVFQAGRVSARDPHATFATQRSAR